MALIGPVLDDRTWEQLRAELVQRIPSYNPEWTDHNAGDPGIALLELFAFLGESLLFRFNQIPDATKLAFLRLLDVQPLPATAASVLAVLTTTNADGVQVLRRTSVTAGAVAFETDDEVYVWPVEVLGAGRVLLDEPGEGDLPEPQLRRERGRRDDARARIGLGPAAAVRFYETRLLSGTALDVADTVDRSLWVALLRGDTTEPERMSGRAIFLAVAFDETIARPFSVEALTAEQAGAFRSERLDEPPPPVLWRIWVPGATAEDDALRPLDVQRDRTRGMTTSGTLSLGLPADFATIAEATARAIGADRPVVPGTGSPPVLDDDEVARQVIGWVQVSRPASAPDAIPPIRHVAVNAVSATQLSTAPPELLGTGDGEAHQQFGLVQRNVLAGSVVLEVEEAGGWRAWTEVEDFVATRDPADRHYVVDPADGIVRFPAGGRGGGRVPQIAERVRVRSYRFGGGTAGNVPAGAVGAVIGVGDVTITNPLPAVGGREAEPLVEALERIPAEVHRRDRAVTEDDFAALAQAVAGVVRAHVLPLFHPDAPAVRAAGVVSVVVFPDADPAHPGAPLPDRGLLRRVARHLDRRRLITTELYVIPPDYVPIAISVGVVVRDDHQVDAVRRWVELIVRQFLAPVPPFGPDGRGWPFGRAVRAAELEAVAVQVEGVEYLDGLRLAVRDVDRGWREVGLVELARHQVPEVETITVVGGAPLPPGAGQQPQAPGAPPGTVLLPLPREVC